VVATVELANVTVMGAAADIELSDECVEADDLSGSSAFTA
jgi:hypothetical protein